MSAAAAATARPMLLTTAEASERLRISAPTLASWRTAGRGPKFMKLGGRVMYREDHLQEWMDARVFETNAEWQKARA